MNLRAALCAYRSAPTQVVLASVVYVACSSTAERAPSEPDRGSAGGAKTSISSSGPLGGAGSSFGGRESGAGGSAANALTPSRVTSLVGLGGSSPISNTVGAAGNTASGDVGGARASATVRAGDGGKPSSVSGRGSGGGRVTAGTRGTEGGAAGKSASGVGGRSNASGGRAGGASVSVGIGGTTSPVGACSTEPTSGGKRSTTAVKNLPVIKEMPDPLTMNDGTKVTTSEQWKARRREMIQILEDYEYGHMPPPPCNVTAKTATASQRISVTGGSKADYRMMRLTFGPSDKLGFDLGIFTPVPATDGPARFPVLISLTMSADKSSLADASAALSRGYAVATVPYQQLGADSSNWASSAFFPAYPDYDWRDISAWAWGLSRAVDYLVTDSAIDPDKILITGVSRLAQAVLVAGAFDERIALSAPVAGGAALRFSGKEMGGGLGQGITEVVDQVTYWFGPRFPEFKNQTTRLPCDQHWLPALTAPRLFIMCNSLSDEYGRAYAAAQTYLAAKPVYAFLEADENLGVHFRAGGHGITSEDWSAILDFADQYLLKRGGTKEFDVLPSADQMP